MALVALWLLVLLAAALPGVLPRGPLLAAHAPDLWAAIVVYLALRGRGFAAVGWGIVLGLVRDSLSLDPLGTHAFVLGTVAWLFCEGRRHRTDLSGLPLLVVTFGAVLAAGWLTVLRSLPLGDGAAQAADLLHAVPTALWTTVAAAALYPLLDRFRVFDELLGRRRGLPA